MDAASDNGALRPTTAVAVFIKRCIGAIKRIGTVRRSPVIGGGRPASSLWSARIAVTWRGLADIAYRAPQRIDVSGFLSEQERSG